MNLELNFRETIQDITITKNKYFFELVISDGIDKLTIGLPINTTYPDSSRRKLIHRFNELLKEVNRNEEM